MLARRWGLGASGNGRVAIGIAFVVACIVIAVLLYVGLSRFNGAPTETNQQAIANEIASTIRDTEEFGVSNDPYGEHDMGSFMHDGDRVFWKIDYYDTDLQYGSPDPANPAVTTRVLTIMLASEY